MSKESGLNRLTWILIGAVVSGSIGLGFFYLQSNFFQTKPILRYSSLNSIPFSGDESNIGIYHVEISNDGKTTIKNIICVIIIDGASIEEYQIYVEPSIKYSEEKLEDRFSLEIPMLNSQEKMSVSLLTTSVGELPSKAEVSLRGEDVIGSEFVVESDAPEMIERFTVLITVTAAGGTVFTLFIRYLRRRENKQVSDFIEEVARREREVEEIKRREHQAS